MNKENVEKDNYIIIIYKPKENNDDNDDDNGDNYDNGGKIRIFGRKFIENNKDNCDITYNGISHKLTEFFEDIEEKYDHKGEILLTLNGINNITDISYIFAKCKKLESIIILPKNIFF